MPNLDAPYLLFGRANGGRIKVTEAVLQVLRTYAQHERHATEAGGVLLGRYLQGSLDIVVDLATGPMPGDRRTRYSFFRDKARHQALIEAAWLASEGTCTYLGEWHTHPEPHPTPSSVDWADWRRRLRVDSYHDELLFLIVGTAEIRAWAGKGLWLPTTPLPFFPTAPLNAS